jgi:hypothetical protein
MLKDAGLDEALASTLKYFAFSDAVPLGLYIDQLSSQQVIINIAAVIYLSLLTSLLFSSSHPNK